MTPASARFIFLGRSYCLRDRASRTAHVLHTKLRRQLSLSLPPQPTLITPPLKTWAQRGAPALATSFFPIGAIRRADRLEGATERSSVLFGQLPEPFYSSAEDHSGHDHGIHSHLVIQVSDHHAEGSSRNLRTGNPTRNSPSFPRAGATFSFPVPQSKIYAASPRAQPSPTTAIARTATDARDRHLGLDRAAHRLPVGESGARHPPEQDAWLVPTIVQLEPANWFNRERGEIGLRSPWRRQAAWPRGPVARASMA